jgi:hypothetical protein
MATTSLARSGLVTFQKYSSLLVGNPSYVPPTFQLLESVTLTSGQGSIEFTNLATKYAGEYRHLQLRMLLRDDSNAVANGALVRLNGDTSTNYAYHGLSAGGSSVTSFNVANAAFGLAANIPSAQAPAGIFAVAVLDLFDAFNTSKFKTARVTCAHNLSSPNIELRSWHWRNTAATSTIRVGDSGSNLIAGCRVSLYGIKATA